MTESTWSAGEPYEHTDRFTWERLIRDPKVGMPRETLCLALLLATYSTGTTGREIRVTEVTLRDILRYTDERSARRLVAELRDGWGVIRRMRRGNQHRPSEHALVIPSDLIERAERLRRPLVHRTPKSGATPRVHPDADVYRTTVASAPDNGAQCTGQRCPTTKRTKQTKMGGPVSGASVEGTRAGAGEASPPDTATREGTEAERRRQHDALNVWLAAHPEHK